MKKQETCINYNGCFSVTQLCNSNDLHRLNTYEDNPNITKKTRRRSKRRRRKNRRRRRTTTTTNNEQQQQQDLFICELFASRDGTSKQRQQLLKWSCIVTHSTVVYVQNTIV